jgi:hypothetical protein
MQSKSSETAILKHDISTQTSETGVFMGRMLDKLNADQQSNNSGRWSHPAPVIHQNGVGSYSD